MKFETYERKTGKKVDKQFLLVRLVYSVLLSADPTEHFDIADQHPDIVADMIRKLEKYRESLVPAHLESGRDFPLPDIVAQTGVWSPGWC